MIDRKQIVLKAQMELQNVTNGVRAIVRNNHAHNKEDIKYESLLLLNTLTDALEQLHNIERKLDEYDTKPTS